MMKRAFTLLEVCLAIAVMSTSVLSVVILYSMGFRETRQSREDVASSAYAEAVISPLVNAITATNLKWSVFRDLPCVPNDTGWTAYYSGDGLIEANPQGKAESAYATFMARLAAAAEGSLGMSAGFPSGARSGLTAGLVIMHEEDSAVVRIAFRAAQRAGMLMSAPLYYTEARFQGIPDK